MLLDIYSERGREGGESHTRVSAHRFCRNELPRGRRQQEGSEKLQVPNFTGFGDPWGSQLGEERASVSLNGCAFSSGGGTP